MSVAWVEEVVPLLRAVCPYSGETIGLQFNAYLERVRFSLAGGRLLCLLPVPSVQDFGISLQGQMLLGAEPGLRSSLDVPSDYGGFRHEQLRSHRRWADTNGRRQHTAIRRAGSTASASATKSTWNRRAFPKSESNGMPETAAFRGWKSP